MSLYNNMSLNRGGVLDAKSLVKKGDRVEEGQDLADSNQSRGRELALGRNIPIALMPYYGHNYEDGTVSSESAAKKLTSAKIYDLSQKPNASSWTSAGRLTTYGNQTLILIVRPRNAPHIGDFIHDDTTRTHDQRLKRPLPSRR